MTQAPFKLEQLFGSKTRARLLALFLQQPEKAFFVRELTRRIDAQLNSVRRELKNLLDIGIVTEQVGAVEKKGASLAEKKKFYSVNRTFMLYEDLRMLFKKVQILLKQNLVQEIDEKGTIDYLAFTGSFMHNSDVPTDILIVGSIDQKVLQKVVAGFEAEMGHEVNYTLMPKEEFGYRRQVVDRFLASILEGEKIVMINRLGL
jgi:predicted DNA-binding transcriptional regulator